MGRLALAYCYGMSSTSGEKGGFELERGPLGRS